MCPLGTGIRSLAIAPEGHLIVGTRGAQVVEIDMAGQLKKKIVEGHYAGVASYAEVWGCAVHPKEQKFVTCGSDKLIRLWEPTRQLALSPQPFQYDVTALDWSHDGTFIVVGDRKGQAHLIDPKSLQVLGTVGSKLTQGKHPWVEDIKISPDNKMVAFGTHDGLSNLEIVSVDLKAAAGNKFVKFNSGNTGITSALTHLDWSIDSQNVMINSQANELMFIDATQKGARVQQTRASSMKDAQWYTWTVLHGWACQGIWPGVDYTDVNSIDRSHDGTILATGDDFGNVKLFKFPCTEKKAQFQGPYKGHSSHVTKVKFTANDSLLITTGGGDKTVFVWDTSLTNDSEFDMRDQQPAQKEEDPEVEIDYSLYDDLTDHTKQQKQDFKDERTSQLKQEYEESKARV